MRGDSGKAGTESRMELLITCPTTNSKCMIDYSHFHFIFRPEVYFEDFVKFMIIILAGLKESASKPWIADENIVI